MSGGGYTNHWQKMKQTAFVVYDNTK